MTLRLALAAAALLAAGTACAETVPEPSGYRMEEYRGPVPATLAGARVIDTKEAEALWREKSAVFIDVLPRPPKPENLPAGTVWRDKPRDDIPGSLWLANVGFGDLSANMLAYFIEGLGAASGGDKGKPLVFYCLEECWMSWNAAKRAVEAGYGRVIWYPDGTDGWSAAGLPLEKREPVPLPAD